MSQHDNELSGSTEDPVPAPTWSVGIAGTLIFIFCVLVIAALYYRMDAMQHGEAFVAPPVIAVEQLKADQLARLAGPPRLEKRTENAGALALVIPVDQAIDLYLQDAGVPESGGD